MATKFRALRNFIMAGRGDVRIGEILELNDEQARQLVILGDTVEPVDKSDRKRIVERHGLKYWQPDIDLIRAA